MALRFAVSYHRYFQDIAFPVERNEQGDIATIPGRDDVDDKAFNIALNGYALENPGYFREGNFGRTDRLPTIKGDEAGGGKRGEQRIQRINRLGGIDPQRDYEPDKGYGRELKYFFIGRSFDD